MNYLLILFEKNSIPNSFIKSCLFLAEKAKDENVESVVPDVMGNVIEGSDHSTDGELAESVYESHTDSGSSDTSHSGAHKPSDRRKSRSYSASRLRNKTRYLKRFAAKSSHLNQSHNGMHIFGLNIVRSISLMK